MQFLGLWRESAGAGAGRADDLDACAISIRRTCIGSPSREGVKRLGLIDFQDAVIGPPAYDVASLLQDARVEMPADLELRLLAYLRAIAGREGPKLRRRRLQPRPTRSMGAQRATKILGLFARLDRRDGKPQYLQHLPRIERSLVKNLPHPDAAAAAPMVRDATAARVRRRRATPARSFDWPPAFFPRPRWCSPPGAATRMRPITGDAAEAAGRGRGQDADRSLPGSPGRRRRRARDRQCPLARRPDRVASQAARTAKNRDLR